jgi:hypothetical protein
MGPVDGDDSGYDRTDEADDFRGWSDKRRAAASPAEEEPVAKPPPKTLTERLADAARDRENDSESQSD